MVVSVIIPAYNHEQYIGEAIESILGQSLGDFELIIINDGSTDRTEEEILKYKDPRITYLSQVNSGAHNTINKGISIARGGYISILNSDDVYLPDRLERCLAFLEQNRMYSIVITAVEGIDNIGLPVTKKKTPQIKAWLNWYRDALNLYESGDFLLSAFAKNILITTSNYFVKKDVFENIGGFTCLRYTHDWDMLIRMSQHYKIHLMKDVLLKYRFHELNTVHEPYSEAKVKFEVNWLIAKNFRRIKHKGNLFNYFMALRKNHYISLEVLALLLAVDDPAEFGELLNFRDPLTLKILEMLR